MGLLFKQLKDNVCLLLTAFVQGKPYIPKIRKNKKQIANQLDSPFKTQKKACLTVSTPLDTHFPYFGFKVA